MLIPCVLPHCSVQVISLSWNQQNNRSSKTGPIKVSHFLLSSRKNSGSNCTYLVSSPGPSMWLLRTGERFSSPDLAQVEIRPTPCSLVGSSFLYSFVIHDYQSILIISNILAFFLFLLSLSRICLTNLWVKINDLYRTSLWAGFVFLSFCFFYGYAVIYGSVGARALSIYDPRVGIDIYICRSIPSEPSDQSKVWTTQ